MGAGILPVSACGENIRNGNGNGNGQDAHSTRLLKSSCIYATFRMREFRIQNLEFRRKMNISGKWEQASCLSLPAVKISGTGTGKMPIPQDY
ncbi:MAG: hypothetical protein F6K39_32060 [Okeania sp. SIO3B3]|nr:hypothetical protein [Okeania sp. SIO3B3]